MKIFFLSTHINIGGIAVYLLNLSRALKQKGHTVKVISSGGSLENEFKKSGIELLNLDIKTKSEVSPKLLFAYFKLNKIFAAEHPDIIHAHFGMAGAAVMGFVESLKVPLVVTFYGVDISYCLKFKYWVKRYQELFKRADILVVLCDEAKKQLVDIGCPEGKIRVWNCLVDLEGYPYAPRQDAKGRIKFITAARFVEKKGYRILLEAFKRLIVEGRDFYLTAAGYGPLREDIQKTINEDGLSDRVRLINTENVPDFYSLFKELLYSHDIFVMASVRSKSGDDEGGPALSLIYAQSSGMPVIASDFPGAERSVLDGKTGLVFSSGDVDGLKDRMAYLAEDSDARSRLGRQGSQFVKDRFSIAGQTEEIIRIYREAMGRP